MKFKKLVNTEYGKIYVMENDIIGREIISGTYHEKNIIEMLNSTLNDKLNPHVLDVGSNIGSISLGLLSLNKSLSITSIEAQEALAKIQKETMILNNYTDRIKIYNNAIGHILKRNVTMSGNFNEIDSVNNGKIAQVYYDDNHVRNFGGLSLGKNGEIVDMITIDSLNLKSLDLLKIDVEGAESLVIYGGKETIKKFKPIIFYEDNWKKVNDDMIQTLNINNDVLNFNIRDFLISVGYKNEKKVDDNWLWW